MSSENTLSGKQRGWRPHVPPVCSGKETSCVEARAPHGSRRTSPPASWSCPARSWPPPPGRSGHEGPHRDHPGAPWLAGQVPASGLVPASMGAQTWCQHRHRRSGPPHGRRPRRHGHQDRRRIQAEPEGTSYLEYESDYDSVGTALRSTTKVSSQRDRQGDALLQTLTPHPAPPSGASTSSSASRPDCWKRSIAGRIGDFSTKNERQTARTTRTRSVRHSRRTH